MSRKQLRRNPGQPPLNPYDPHRLQNPATIRDEACGLSELPLGDSGAGERRLKRRTIFSRLFDNVDSATLNPFEKYYAMVQDPPMGISYDNCRYRMFNVKFWGQSLIRTGDDGNDTWLPERENAGFNNGPSDPWNMVPSPLKGYIQTDDGMYYTFDILGRRSFEIYATHVDAGVLAPVSSYDATALANDGSQDIAYDGIVDQSYVGVSVSSVVVNSSQREDESSRNIRLDDSTSVLVPVVPGSRSVCITTPAVGGGGAVLAAFTWNPTLIATKMLTDIEIASEIIVAGQTKRLCVPNTPFIRFSTTSTTPLQMGVTFSSEL